MSRPARPDHAPRIAMLAVCAVFSLGAAWANPALDDIHPGEAMSERFLSRDRNGGVLVNLFLEGDITPAALRDQGIEVNAHAGRITSARCPLPLLSRLLALGGIERVEVAGRCKPTLDRSAPDVRAEKVRSVIPTSPTPITGQTGAGVVVGLVDTGIDTSNPDFQHEDGTTRILSIWDQTAAGTPPPGFTYGTESSAAQINAGTASEIDGLGHGTHVAGIAAGNGRATGNFEESYQYVGIAPEADLCVVKTTFQNTAIVDGVSYIFQKAASLGKRAVVNLSLGTQEGPHDGTLALDQMLNALTGPGKIIVTAAGNEGNSGLHGQVIVGASAQNMTLVIPPYTDAPGTGNDFVLLSGWYSGLSRISLTVTTPGGSTLGPVAMGQNLLGQSTTDGFVDIRNATTPTTNGAREILVQIYDANASHPPGNGAWTFTFTPVFLGGGGRVDTYIYESALAGGNGPPVVWTLGAMSEGTIDSPGDADSVVTVGAHATKACWQGVDADQHCWFPIPTLGAIAPFTSRGPRRDGAFKPDLVAPGLGVTSSLSADFVGVAQLAIATDGVHVNFSGTSMSSPHVAGATAILLARSDWAAAGPTAIRARFQATARADSFTGTVPNWIWGSGKLDLGAAIPPPVIVVRPTKGFLYAAGRYDSTRVTVSGFPADTISFFFSKDGGNTYPTLLGTVTNIPDGGSASLQFFADPSLMTTQGKIRAVSRFGAMTLSGVNDSLFTIGVPSAVEEDPAPAPARFALAPNAPNPFNPVTTIRFELDHAGPATLRVYSVSGSLVRTLLDRNIPAGRYHSMWDGLDESGRPVASGVYVYRLVEGGRQISRKMSLLK